MQYYLHREKKSSSPQQKDKKMLNVINIDTNEVVMEVHGIPGLMDLCDMRSHLVSNLLHGDVVTLVDAATGMTMRIRVVRV